MEMGSVPATSMAISKLSTVSLSVDRSPWAYDQTNRAKIEKFWKRAVQDNPTLHNGDVFMLTNWQFAGDALSGTVQPASFAGFLYWREQGFPETGARNCFGSSVLQSREGYLLFGRMAPHTSTSGLVYPVGGSLSSEDVHDDRLEIETNIARELQEETGLKPEDGMREEGYICVEEGPRISLAARFMFDCDANALRQRIKAHLDASDEPELDEVVIFRRKAFARHHRMPQYARMLIDHLLTQ
jgi:8-oxo-dGTP pyrophosphatase MutT (NUDIX family)